MRRSVISIAANIAEGHARRSTRDYIRFLSMANGSLRELETHLEVSSGLEYTSPEQRTEALRLGTEIGKMLNGLRDALKRRERVPPPNPQS
jgi:four helix bundle protein